MARVCDARKLEIPIDSTVVVTSINARKKGTTAGLSLLVNIYQLLSLNSSDLLVKVESSLTNINRTLKL
jgi:hypothetical protein